MRTLRSLLEAALGDVEGLQAGESAFGSGPGYWVDGTEILHFDGPEAIDLRLTRSEIRRRREQLRADPRVHLRSSSSADWLEIRLTGPDDLGFVVGLVAVAVLLHRPPRGRPARLPPTDGELERRRRFH